MAEASAVEIFLRKWEREYDRRQEAKAKIAARKQRQREYARQLVKKAAAKA